MKITLRTEPRAEALITEAQQGCTIEDLLDRFRGQLAYPVYAARLDNRVVRLDTRLERDCEVVFLDMRDFSAKTAYQNSIIAIYLKACKDLMPDAEILIENPLNRGIYSTAKSE